MNLGRWNDGEFVPSDECKKVESVLGQAGRSLILAEIMAGTGMTPSDTVVTVEHMFNRGVVYKQFTAGALALIVRARQAFTPEIHPQRRVDRFFEATGILEVDYDSIVTSYGLNGVEVNGDELILKPVIFDELPAPSQFA